MSGTSLVGIAQVLAGFVPQRSARSTRRRSKLVWASAIACCALALAGCGSVQVSSAGGSLPTGASGGTTGGVSAANPDLPIVTGAPATAAKVGVAYDYVPSVTDPLGSALSFTITNMPAWASFNAATGELLGTPAADDVGSTAEIEIVVSNGAGLATIGPFRITISPAESSPPTAQDPPVISGTPDTSVTVGQAYSFTPTATDPSAHALTFSIINRPAWATFSTLTGELSGTPAVSAVGSFANITISVSNGTATVSLPAFTLQVVAPPAAGAPTIAGVPENSIKADSAYSFTPTASDPGGLALTFSIKNRPSWASFNTDTGELSGTPSASDVGNYTNITISVSDGAASASLAPFTIKVAAITADGPPTIKGTPATVANVGSAYSFTPTASDPAGSALTFSIQNLPTWADFDKATGRLSGTPTAGNIGAFTNIKISVSDGSANASLTPFTITVLPQVVDGPPSIHGTPATSVTVGAAYSFTPTATDPQGHALTFAIQNQPSWATFHASTGQLSGTPAAANVGSYPNITISVSNGTSSAFLAAFTISVSAASAAPPTISGTPATTVSVGAAYSFVPTASDPQGRTLTFSISNRPTWASFNTNTGQLSGTPSAGNVGTFSNVVISVSNGAASAALAGFTITVSAGSATPPTISGTPATTVNVGANYNFVPTASDPQGRALTFSISNRPTWASFNTNTGQLSGIPSAGNVGTFSNVVISVSNGAANAALPGFTITVAQPAGGPPTISGNPAKSVNVGSSYSFTPTASDPQGHALTFTIQNQPSWADFNKNTGQLSGTPASGNVGTFSNIVISVSNGTASASLASFSINVTAVSNGTATVDWTIPTQNTNGTQLTNLAGYRIYYGTSPTNLSQTVQINNPSVATYELDNLTQGTWYFAVLDFTSSGVESSLSNVASKTIQ